MHFGELFEVCHERERDVVQRAVRLALARKVYVCDAVGVFDSGIACEPVQHQGEPLISFHVAGTFEEFIQHRADEILFGWDEARHRDFIGKLPTDQAIVIGEVDIHFYKQGRAG